jgi:hypothetical protein
MTSSVARLLSRHLYSNDDPRVTWGPTEKNDKYCDYFLRDAERRDACRCNAWVPYADTNTSSDAKPATRCREARNNLMPSVVPQRRASSVLIPVVLTPVIKSNMTQSNASQNSLMQTTRFGYRDERSQTTRHPVTAYNHVNTSHPTSRRVTPVPPQNMISIATRCYATSVVRSLRSIRRHKTWRVWSPIHKLTRSKTLIKLTPSFAPIAEPHITRCKFKVSVTRQRASWRRESRRWHIISNMARRDMVRHEAKRPLTNKLTWVQPSKYTARETKTQEDKIQHGVQRLVKPCQDRVSQAKAIQS